MKKFSRHDLSYLVSVGTFIVTLAAIITGLMAEFWDLNQFVYHVYAGYALILFALLHVLLVGGRVIGYLRWRFRRRPAATSGDASPRRGAAKKEAAPAVRGSRRAVLQAIGAGAGGVIAGRYLNVRPQAPNLYGTDIGVAYHEWSKPKITSLFGTLASWGDRPAPYKEYHVARKIQLPAPGEYQGLLTEEAIHKRQSLRAYSGVPMTLEELSRLLYYCGGITHEYLGYQMRSAPSSGALFPIETYLVVNHVESVNPGLYHYAVREHALTQLHEGDLRAQITHQGFMQAFLGEANVVLVFTGIFQRMRWKYQERSYRYALLEAGHLGQNVYLQATSMGLGACAVGAFRDDDLNAMLGVDGVEEAALYILAAGKI